MFYQILAFTLSAMLLGPIANAQKADAKAIEKTIRTFSKAGDEQNVNDLEVVLDASYRVVMNRLFGSTTAIVMTRDAYLDKIRNKEFGGDSRKVTIENVLINGETASAKVTFKGAKMTFVSLMTLVKTAEGNWMLVSDLPSVIQ